MDRLSEEDYYDLVIVPMRKNRVPEILPVLAANKNVPTFLFMMNNAAGQQPFIDAVGKERVMAGLPQPVGFKKGHVMHMMPVDAKKPMMMPIGEVDGKVTARTLEVAKIMGSMRGYRIEIRKDIDHWLKTHVALIIPAMASAVYACNTDQEHFAATRDAHVLLKRALHEALLATEDAGVTLTPPGIKVVERIPEPLFVSAIGNMAKTPIFENILGHLKNAEDEIEYLTDEFYAMIRKSNTPTPTVDQLTAYTYGSKQFLPFGSKEIPLRWGAIYGIAVGVAAVAGSRAGEQATEKGLLIEEARLMKQREDARLQRLLFVVVF
ncbi:hypothetical protein [Planococcus sp. ISL-110]|uniref:ketopantoate reductase family protein n=1 Tax=Planococcus sp. ISL-110 TaxID=2819167 RepID=UPI001BE6BE79|nr:hypothetical protein [Planococcus sp. ISL-110]MBT2571318.1 hypothetical protein [Planococcus sp. ISL-110]